MGENICGLQVLTARGWDVLICVTHVAGLCYARTSWKHEITCTKIPSTSAAFSNPLAHLISTTTFIMGFLLHWQLSKLWRSYWVPVIKWEKWDPNPSMLIPSPNIFTIPRKILFYGWQGYLIGDWHYRNIYTCIITSILFLLTFDRLGKLMNSVVIFFFHKKEPRSETFAMGQGHRASWWWKSRAEEPGGSPDAQPCTAPYSKGGLMCHLHFDSPPSTQFLSPLDTYLPLLWISPSLEDWNKYDGYVNCHEVSPILSQTG